jgi:hypothetical protein
MSMVYIEEDKLEELKEDNRRLRQRLSQHAESETGMDLQGH